MPIKKGKLDAINGYREYQARKKQEQEEARKVSSSPASTAGKKDQGITKATGQSASGGSGKKATIRKEKLDAIPQYREAQSRQAAQAGGKRTGYLETARNATQKNIQNPVTSSAEDIQSRITELEKQGARLNSFIRGAMNGAPREQVKSFQDELSNVNRELSSLRSDLELAKQGSTISRLDQLNRQLSEARTEESAAQAAVNKLTGGKPYGYMPADPSELSAAYTALNTAKSARKKIESQIEQIEYLNKYQDKTYEDNFAGQFAANYNVGRMGQDSSLAWNDYLMNPTDENRARAEAIDELITQFQLNNEETLADDGTLPWLSKSLANYIPQFADQLKYQAGGAAAGALGGSLIPGAGTVAGAKAGAVAGSGLYSYQTMRGAAYSGLLDLGVDPEIARAASNDEAVISSLIEMADTGLDIATLGVGKLLKSLGKTGVKAVAGKSAQSAGKKLLKALAGYGLNIAGEMLEEGTQEAVSIANENRVVTGPGDSGTFGLAKDAAGVFYNAVRGDENTDRVWEASKEGGKIAAMMGGATALTTNLANTAVERANNRRLSNLGTSYQADPQAVIDEGLSFSPDTEAYQTASELKAKVDAGETLTDADVGRAVVANERAIRREQANAAPAEAPETLEDAAREVVAQREKTAKSAASEATGHVQNVPYNVMIDENPVRQQKVNAEKLVKKMTGYGEYGTRAIMDVMEQENVTLEQAKAQFQTAYEAGMTDMPVAKANLTSDLQRIAFNAGKQDYIMSMKKDTENAKYATVYGKESGFIPTDAAQGVSQSTKDTLNTISMALGIKSRYVESITRSDGREANASMSGDGILSISRSAEKPDYVLVAHESTHRMQQLAPKEYRAFRDFAVQSSGWLEGRLESGVMATTEVEQMQKDYGGISTDEAMDEIAAEFAEKLFTDEDALRAAINEANKTPEHRTAMQKFFDTVRDVVKKLKQAIAKLRGKADVTELENTISDLERARGLWLEAYHAAEKNAQETKNTAQTDGVKYSLNAEFTRELDAWIQAGKKGGGYFRIGTTSEALQSIGVKDYAIYWDKTKIAKIMKSHPEMTQDIIAQVPNILEHPVIVMQSNTVANRIMVYGELMTADNVPVMAALELRPQNKRGEILDFSKIASAYGREQIQNDINTSDILYLDPNKKRTNTWLEALRLQLPAGLTKYGSISMVTYANRDVNGNLTFGESGKTSMQAAFEKAMEQGTFSDNVSYSLKVTDKDTLDFLDKQKTITTYKTMQLIDGKLYPPMAARIDGTYEDASVLGAWEQSTEHPELIRNGNKFKLDKGKGQGSIEAAYNPYMHSSNLVLNDQFSGAYKRDNLFTIECEVPVSELTSGYHAQYAKDSVGWHAWHTGTVAGSLRKQTGVERKVFLSRWIKPVRIVPDAEVAAMYKELLDGTDVAVPDNVVTPSLLAELKKAGVKIKESGRLKELETAGAKYSLKQDSAGRTLTEQQQEYFKDSKAVDENGNLLVMYHGTAKGGFTEFRDWAYLTADRKYAERYTDHNTGKTMYEVYANIKNPFDTRLKKCRDLFNREFQGNYSNTPLQESGLPDWTDGYDLVDWIEENGYDYDAVLLDEGEDPTADGVKERGISYVVRSSEQIKNVTNENPTKSRDIRFSLKQNDLMKENAKLKETVDGLREQFKVTTFAQVDKKSLDRFTKQLLKDYESGAEINDTREALSDLYGYMANGEDGQTPAWNEVYKRAYDVAVSVLENASTLDDSLWQEYKPLRDELRTRGLTLDRQYTSDLAGYESIEDFRKAHFGKIKMVNNGTPVDVAYADLAMRYPEFFDETAHTNPADQLLDISETLERLQPVEVNPYSYNMRESATWLANDIIERFYDLPQAKPTFADKANQKLTKQVIKDAKKMERMRYQKNERIKALIEENREKVKAVQAKEREKRAEAVQGVKEHYKAKEAKFSDNRKARELRAKIMRHAQDLSTKLLRPTDKQHIPQQLQGAVAELLSSINLESNYTLDPETQTYKKSDDGLPTRRTKAFTELKQVYQELANTLVIDPDLMGDDGLLSDVIAMADKRIVDMNRAELETVWKTVRAVEATVMTANKAFSKSKWASISEAAEGFREDNKGKSLKTEYRGGLGKMQKLTGLDMMTPETYMHLLGESGDGIFRVIRDAQDAHIRKMAEVSDFTHEKLKNVNVNKLENDMHTVTLGGEDVKLSTAQLMELYVLMRRQQAQDHILTGGILPDVVSAKGIKKITRAEPVRGITIQEIGKALSVLTDEQKKTAEALQSFASTTLSKWGNEASMQVYNYEKFNEPVYWPIRTNRQEISSDVSKDTAVTTVAGRGFTKQTKPNANTSVRLGSIFDTFATHSSEMATYAAWLGATEDINRIRNYQFMDKAGNRTGTVKGIIERVHGTQGTAYLNKLLSDISNGVKGTHAETQFMSGIVGNYKAAAVGANLRVIIQQPTAILRAMDMIGPQYLVAGMKPSGGWKKAVKYAPIAQWKDWGYFDINTGRQMKDVLFDSDDVLNKVKNVSMWGAGKADSISWGLLWNACEAETKAKRADLKAGTDAYYQAVAERFTEIVDHTQVVDGIVQRSQIMRSADGLTKMATSFMGEPTKQYNMFLSAAYDAKHVKSANTKKRLARSAVTLVVSGVVNAMAQSVMDAVRDDDKEKKYWEKWLNAMIGFEGDEDTAKDYWDAFWAGNLGNTFNPATYIPYLKDIVSIIQGYDVSRMDMESVEKTISAAQNMIKALNGDGKYTIGAASANLFAEAARMIGVPVANLKRDVKSIAMTYAIQTDNYLMQYRMEKASLDLNYSLNGSTFMDILYNAYVNDQDAYELIYADMVASGYDTEKLANAMESRMKKAAGVKKVSELESRYLIPDQQKAYDSKMKPIQSSSLWKKASEEQRDALENDLYNIVTGSDAGLEMQEKIADGAPYGLDETEYLLYQLAKDMYDTPNKSGEYGGTPTNEEKADAILSIPGLGNSEMAYLWDSDDGYEAYAAGIDMEKFIQYRGDGGKTGVEKIIDAKNAGIEEDTYFEFLDMLKAVDQPTESGKYGSYTQAEAAEAIRNMPGLSNAERAYLWQSVNKSWKANKNPWG